MEDKKILLDNISSKTEKEEINKFQLIFHIF